MQHVEDESEHLCFHPDKHKCCSYGMQLLYWYVSSVEFQSEATVTTLWELFVLVDLTSADWGSDWERAGHTLFDDTFFPFSQQAVPE